MSKKATGRSASGLRETLFSVIDGLLDGTVEIDVARAVTTAAHCIMNSVSTQIEFERLRLLSEVPSALPDMKLIGISENKTSQEK